MEAFTRCLSAVDGFERVLFMDEAVFSSAQVTNKVWFGRQRERVVVQKKKAGFKAIAVAAAIDMDGKIAGLHICDHSIDRFSYVKFLEDVHKNNDNKDCIMLVDNLAVHRTKLVRDYAASHGIELLFNGTYSSNYNPIERLWAWSKHRF